MQLHGALRFDTLYGIDEAEITMTKSYVVSGQGIRCVDEHYCVPAHVEIHFYRARRQPPRIYKPRTILDKLMVEVGVFPDWIAVSGEFVPIHYCWAGLVERPQSGVFRRSSGDLILDLAGTTASTPVELGHIVDQVAHGRETRLTVLHWLVRTEEVDGGMALPRNVLRPPRLFGGDACDTQESQQIPLLMPVARAAPRDAPKAAGANPSKF